MSIRNYELQRRTFCKKGKLSSFVEQSLRANIERRLLQSKFTARGLASRDEARKTGEYVTAEKLLAEQDAMLCRAEGR